MKLIITTIAAVLLAGCGESQQKTTLSPTEVKLIEPVAETAKPEPPVATATPPVEAQPSEPVAEVPAQQPSPPAELKPTVQAAKDIKPTNPAADRALLDAAMNGNIASIKQHLDAGANVSTKDANDWTPLYNAGKKEIAELLISRGADVNATDKSGWTPLHAAVMGGKETVELLIANGANVNARVASGSYKGMTPLDLASKTEIADLIRKHGGESGN